MPHQEPVPEALPRAVVATLRRTAAMLVVLSSLRLRLRRVTLAVSRRDEIRAAGMTTGATWGCWHQALSPDDESGYAANVQTLTSKMSTARSCRINPPSLSSTKSSWTV